MKENGNDSRQGDYYVGIDAGTNSIGWAVTDENYRVKKFKGNAMWGVRLFDEAQGADERRTNRTARRRLVRKKQRLMLLELLFAEEIAKVDPNFYLRMQESGLWRDDKTGDSQFALFNDEGFTDREYFQKYPTAYHLRCELLHSEDPHDIRLVYLALHHIMKTRGHFLLDGVEDVEQMTTLDGALDELAAFLQEEYELYFVPKNRAEFIAALETRDIGINARKKALKDAYGKAEDAEDLSIPALLDLLAGAAVKPEVLFEDNSLKDGDVSSISFKNFEDEQENYSELLGDRMETLLKVKNLFDTAQLALILNDKTYISEAKVAQYEQNGHELHLLKEYVRKRIPDKYKLIFDEKKEKLDNYVAYSGDKRRSGAYTCTQEAFCKFLRGKNVELPEPDASDTEMCTIYAKIKDNIFLPKLRSSENGVIPYQLNKQELERILELAAQYLPFLNVVDDDGLSVREKIVKTFEFRVPYYVGPVSDKAKHRWAVRFDEKAKTKVLPWNFEHVIDTEGSAIAFMEQLIGRCTYTGEKVLPKDSLLYSEFALLNELNLLKINGKSLPINVKKQLVQDLFYSSKKNVTKKTISRYLRAEGLMTEEDEVSGIDDKIKSKLRSYHDFRDILVRTGDTAMVEDIIRSILVFGNDKKMLRRWLEHNTHDLTEAEIKHICHLNYQDWGRLSEIFLTKIYSPDENGEAKTIMDYLRETNCNLMQLMSDQYLFAENAKKHYDELFGNGQTLTARLDSMYIAPAVRRCIRQTLRIVDEIVDIEKSVPKKIFIEMARDRAQDVKKGRTESRKDKLIALYRSCKETGNELFKRLENEDENRLRSDKLYLYYTQLGRCMYSGEPIDLESLLRGELYDIDHIFPQSRVKDNSLENRVLVKNTLNREKTNEYPIKSEIRKKMQGFWYGLRQKGLIGQKKLERLTRATPLAEAELSSFVARQLVETQQSTKAMATLLQDIYGDKVRIVYSKAGNVSEFRQKFEFIKCRDVNDLHHAKDAYLNIVVGNVYDTKFTQRFFVNIKNEKYSLRRIFEFDTDGAWKVGETIRTVKKYMAKNNVLVTRMPREVRGALFDLQLMPATKGQLARKQGMDIGRYGGYNKLTGAYFCVVEHTEKKKRIRTIEPVYLYQKSAYESDPVAYCKDILGLCEPVIIVPEVRIDSLLEINGSRFMISGRTGNRIVVKHTYQLLLSNAEEQYVKNLGKYNDRCAAKKEELPVTEHDGISAEENLNLYRLLVKKCNEKVYSTCFTTFIIMGNEMKEYENKFIAMSIWEQTKILLEALKAFRCNAVYGNFKELSGKGTRGLILMNKKISELSSAYMINQSITGLYEHRVDLLK